MSARMCPGRPDITIDAIAEQHCFVDVVRDEHHGTPIRRPESEQLVLHVAARLCVERAEGFIH